MDSTEKVFYLVLDGFFFLPLFFSLSAILNRGSSIFLALITAHTLHWLFDGQLYGLARIFGLSSTKSEHFMDYTEGLRERAKKEKSILAIAVFGSLSRKQLTESSDLDIRVIRQPGALNGMRASIFTFLERSRALMGKIPLDVFVCDDFRSLLKLDPEELPVILYDPTGRLEEYKRQKQQRH
jgi:predicted nucleotidyltransferase